MAIPVEQIGDQERVTRLVDFPRMLNDRGEFVLDQLFSFNSDKNGGYQGESLNWNKYATPPDQVHELGRRREAVKRNVNAAMRYSGYIEAGVDQIRAAKTGRGHGFEIYHVPSEGQHHAEVHIAKSPEQAFAKSDRSELRELLRKTFSDLVPVPQI